MKSMEVKDKFFCYRVEEIDGKFETGVKEMDINDLPEGNVLVEVKYSALNYKDALSSSGHRGITRKFPHTPGIDAAGIVVKSDSDKIAIGTEVIVTSYDLGMNTHGGFSEYIRVPDSWVVPLPDGLSLRDAMIIGTAGLTAGMALYKMEEGGQTPAMGPILVTGATGGVGSMACSLLISRGYEVIASTGSLDLTESLLKSGIKEVIDRKELQKDSGKPVLRPSWAGVVDTIGGITLVESIKQTGRNGNVAVCGLVESADLNFTVYPLILNGINILGIESAEFPMGKRREIWTQLASDWKAGLCYVSVKEIGLKSIQQQIALMLEGKTSGKVLVNINLFG
jgi:acrylyl-CoA reductase (NADPH)